MTAPLTQVRNALATAIEAEYAPEGITVLHDRLYRLDGVHGALVGLSPLSEVENEEDTYIEHYYVLIQCYLRYAKEANIDNRVDPGVIEDLSHRMKQAVQSLAGNDDVWYWRVIEVTYPNDPVGKASRYEATVKAWARNTAMLETIG